MIDLLRRALGAGAVPEILTTVRQQTERERTASLLFREGQAAEALAMKQADGTARLITGDYRRAVQGIADLWQERRAANAGDLGYTLSVSAPTNRDAREIGAAIRQHRRASGELGPDLVVLSAADQAGERFDLPLAVGDRVRLFARTNASYADRSRGIIGNNGSVLEVRGVDASGVVLRNAQEREGRVAWNTLRDGESGRIRLTYGDVLSIDATQGVTSTEHIEAMPAGTQAVNAYKAYTAASRHRRATFLVSSDGAERREVAGRRPLGDMRPIAEADVWANMGRNLSRQPKVMSALEFLERRGTCGVRRPARYRWGCSRPSSVRPRVCPRQHWRRRSSAGGWLSASGRRPRSCQAGTVCRGPSWTNSRGCPARCTRRSGARWWRSGLSCSAQRIGFITDPSGCTGGSTKRSWQLGASGWSHGG